MIESDLAHLRFLHSRCMRGDRLFSNDIVFLVELEGELEKHMQRVAEIRERLEND